jgi:metallo-beta-lactamase class B
MSRRVAFATLFAICSFALGQQQSFPCPSCAEWNAPQAPFRIYGNTYYVGPHGLSSILITSHEGHMLIDGALAESAGQIAMHIRQLGFRVEDVKLIVNSHVHFDHAGGIAELQRVSGSRVVASKWTADVMSKTGVGRDDPQFGVIPPIPLIKRVEVLSNGQTFKIGPIAITAHLTPGHTPGGTSWTWQSCEGPKCLSFVYADSLTAVSADGFKFSSVPTAIQSFQESFSFLRSVPCEVLLTAHPDLSNFWGRVDARAKGVNPDPMVDTTACRNLADRAEDAFRKRIASEIAQ